MAIQKVMTSLGRGISAQKKGVLTGSRSARQKNVRGPYFAGLEAGLEAGAILPSTGDAKSLRCHTRT